MGSICIYEIIIKSKGWNNLGREGASTYYEKEGYRIDLISQTDPFTLIAK